MIGCRALSAALCLVLLSWSSPSRAEDVAAAREHYKRGTVLFNLQRYLEAAKEYEAAYEAKDDPALLFNIAQSYRLGGDAGRALGAYKNYVRNMPRAPNRAEVSQRIEELQKIVDVQQHSREAPPRDTIPPGRLQPA